MKIVLINTDEDSDYNLNEEDSAQHRSGGLVKDEPKGKEIKSNKFLLCK